MKFYDNYFTNMHYNCSHPEHFLAPNVVWQPAPLGELKRSPDLIAMNREGWE